MCVYIYIYIYTQYACYAHVVHTQYTWRPESQDYLSGNRLSNTTCLTQVFFKHGEHYGKLCWSLTRRSTHKIIEAVLDK